jgi:hypothetical protein
VFPIISTTIFQTFAYDTRLGKDEQYLKADYTIMRDDEDHQWYILYSSVMAFLYCAGLPIFALRVLDKRKRPICKLQEAEKNAIALESGGNTRVASATATVAGIKKRDPLLGGLSPLYKVGNTF